MPNFFFQRYVHGERMADDVLITKQPTLEAAIPEALRLCRNSPKSVLVYVPEDNVLSEEITRLREENARLAALSAKASLEASQLREALQPFAEMLKGNYSHQSDDMPIKAGANQYDLVFVFTLGDLRAAAAAIREGDKG